MTAHDVGDVEVFAAVSPQDATRRAGELLAEAASAGQHIALSGGSTPGPAYELAASLVPDWSNATVWWADERCVPPDHELSNYRLARETLLDRLEHAPRVHRIRGELGGEAAAAAYERELDGETLGLAFLGLGADGHTASLFPGSPALDEWTRVAVAAAGPEVERVTLTPRALCGAATVAFFVLGADKAPAVERAFARPPDPGTPGSMIRARRGRTVVVLDRDAAARLER